MAKKNIIDQFMSQYSDSPLADAVVGQQVSATAAGQKESAPVEETVAAPAVSPVVSKKEVAPKPAIDRTVKKGRPLPGDNKVDRIKAGIYVEKSLWQRLDDFAYDCRCTKIELLEQALNEYLTKNGR